MNTLATMAAAALAVLPPAAKGQDPTAWFMPQLLGAQYTFVDQHQDALRSPYAGPLSLHPDGSTARSHTFGVHLGMQLPWRLEAHMDVEMFKGEGVSNATGLAGLTNGDVIRSGSGGLGKRAYVARRYLQWSFPLGTETDAVPRGQDQLPGAVARKRIEIKLGKMAANDDFDHNRYANDTRTQFMNWSLWNNPAWDFAADTRGYTRGLVLALIQPHWTLRYDAYQMPTMANGEVLEPALRRAR